MPLRAPEPRLVDNRVMTAHRLQVGIQVAAGDFVEQLAAGDGGRVFQHARGYQFLRHPRAAAGV